MIAVFATFFVLVLSIIYWYRRDNRLPPGPKGVPLLGVIPYLRGHSAKQFREYSKTWGDVFTVRVGQLDYVVLTDYDVINEVLIKQGSKVDARPPLGIFDDCSKGYGMIFACQRVWSVHRPFVVSSLRRLGMGKKVLEMGVVDEATYLIDALRNSGGKPFDPKELLLLSVVNVAAFVTLGQRFQYDDEEFKEMTHRLVRGWQEDGDFVILMGYCSYLRLFPPFKNMKKHFKDDFDYLYDVILKKVKDHEQTFDKNEIRDFIDLYIEEMQKDEHDQTFNEQQLVTAVKDLLDAGAQTTACTLAWILIALAKYPEYQEKMRKEIEDVLGPGGAVTMAHRENMPLTLAFIYEVMRKAIMAAQSHVMTTGEVTVKDFKLPKGTPVFAAMWVVHNNPKYFEDPEGFHPERFINPDDGSFSKSKYCNPFSVGKRACAGEQLAQIELFIFIVNVIQKFELTCDDPSSLPSFDDGTYGIVYVPPRYKLRFNERIVKDDE